jgi:hypothetical protein
MASKVFNIYNRWIEHIVKSDAHEFNYDDLQAVQEAAFLTLQNSTLHDIDREIYKIIKGFFTQYKSLDLATESSTDPFITRLFEELTAFINFAFVDDDDEALVNSDDDDEDDEEDDEDEPPPPELPACPTTKPTDNDDEEYTDDDDDESVPFIPK